MITNMNWEYSKTIKSKSTINVISVRVVHIIIYEYILSMCVQCFVFLLTDKFVSKGSEKETTNADEDLCLCNSL